MGFCADWVRHWRLLGAECHSMYSALIKHPARSLKIAFRHPLLLVFIYFLLTMYFNSLLSIVGQREGLEAGRAMPPLVDQGFEAFPRWGNHNVPNWLLYILLGSFALRFLPLWPCTRPALFRIVARRWLLLQGNLFLLRGFAVSMTSLPWSDATCQTNTNGSIWVDAFRYIFGQVTMCGDQMYSGHTATVTTIVLLYTKYSRGEEFALCCGVHPGCTTTNTDFAGDPDGYKIGDFLAWMYAIFCYYTFISTRFHYSVDVFIGFIVAFLQAQSYHYYVKTSGMRSSGGSFMSRAVKWFEGMDEAMEDLRREREMVMKVDVEAQKEAGLTGADATAGRSLVELQRAAAMGVGYNPTLPAGKTAATAGAGGDVALTYGEIAAKEKSGDTNKESILPPIPIPTSYLEGHNYYMPYEKEREEKHFTVRQEEKQHAAASPGQQQLYEDGVTEPAGPGAVGTPVPTAASVTELGHDRALEAPTSGVGSAVTTSTTATSSTAVLAGATSGVAVPATASSTGITGHNTTLSHSPPLDSAPLHNYQLPVPVLTPGESAAQERRQVEREHKHQRKHHQTPNP